MSSVCESASEPMGQFRYRVRSIQVYEVILLLQKCTWYQLGATNSSCIAWVDPEGPSWWKWPVWEPHTVQNSQKSLRIWSIVSAEKKALRLWYLRPKLRNVPSQSVKILKPTNPSPFFTDNTVSNTIYLKITKFLSANNKQ